MYVLCYRDIRKPVTNRTIICRSDRKEVLENLINENKTEPYEEEMDVSWDAQNPEKTEKVVVKKFFKRGHFLENFDLSVQDSTTGVVDCGDYDSLLKSLVDHRKKEITKKIEDINKLLVDLNKHLENIEERAKEEVDGFISLIPTVDELIKISENLKKDGGLENDKKQ